MINESCGDAKAVKGLISGGVNIAGNSKIRHRSSNASAVECSIRITSLLAASNAIRSAEGKIMQRHILKVEAASVWRLIPHAALNGCPGKKSVV